MKRLAAVLTLLLALLGRGPGEARADAPKPRSVFALIVTNNHSSALGRPDLHYADDDGVKYAEVFRMLAPEKNVQLLTELDRDTELLVPLLRGKIRPPTRAEVTATAAKIGRAADEALRRGEEVDFYFVFAGHGDVDRGKGFLELRDARFTSDDLEAMLKAIPSTRAHVILDSCNSFFVLNARKPGGRHVAIPAEAVRSLRDRLPNVGALLSTSSEADVFEWSELQSGIFSHAVRSGLMGGADANHDGVISYDELSAFLFVATSKVKNPLYRPKVFSSGPRGRGDEPIFQLANAAATRVELDTAARVRLTVRDAEDLPWIDVHKEEGARVELWIPNRLMAHASIDEREVTERESRVLRRYALDGMPAGGPLRLAAAGPAPSASAARGPTDALRMLFGAPFGPRAMAAYQVSSEKGEEPTYGVSRDDAERMRQLLAQVSDIEKSRRRLVGVGFVAAGAVSLGSAFALRLGNLEDPGVLAVPYIGMGLGAIELGGGMLTLLRPSDGERLYEDFVRDMGTLGPLGEARAVGRTERRLFKLAGEYRTTRWVSFGLSAAMLTACAAGLVATLPTSIRKHDALGPVLLSELGIAGLMTMVDSFTPTPVERMAELWTADPGLKQLPRVSITPFMRGAMIGVSGSF